MGRIANFVGIMMGTAAMALTIASAVVQWLPADPYIRALLKESKEIKLWTYTLPIIGSCILGVALVLLVIDMKADKKIFRVMAIVGFLGAAICVAYGVGQFVSTLVKIGLDIAEDPDGNPTRWSDLSEEEVEGIRQRLNVGNWSEGWQTVESWNDLGLRWGWVVAIVSVVVDLICCGFYACISCCGLSGH